MSEPLTFKFKEIAPVWTGDINSNCEYIHETGIIGSIRWWYEAVVRGYDRYACDPTSDFKCVGDDKSKHCAVCEFFGCADRSSKFRLSVEEKEKEKEKEITMRFVALKTFSKEEEYLLKKTLFIISKYGSIGGRTTRKPDTDKKRNSEAHKDYGLIKLTEPTEEDIAKELMNTKAKNFDINKYFQQFNSKPSKIKYYEEYPNLKYFIFARCNENKWLNKEIIDEICRKLSWLKGRERTKNYPGKSKFIFAFYEGRWWCYSKAIREEDNTMYDNLSAILTNQNLFQNVVKGKDLL